MNPRVLSVNVGRPAPLSTGRRVVESAIGKAPVAGPVAVRGVNLDGDDQADRSAHGGPDQAVYAYASEDAAYWAEQLGRRIPCFKLEARIGVAGFQRAFLHAGRPGAYLAIAAEGELQAGDAVEILHRPDHDVTPALIVETMWLDRTRLAEVEPAAPDMLPKLAEWYEQLKERAA